MILFSELSFAVRYATYISSFMAETKHDYICQQRRIETGGLIRVFVTVYALKSVML